jgi:secreted trypsin-like serine protease
VQRRLAALAVLIGCAGDAPPRAQRAIVGGADEAGDPAVVALVDPQGAVTCTGTVVARDRVLTAAHCVALGPLPRIFVGSDPAAAGTWIDVAEAELHPDYLIPQPGTHDLALLRLADDAEVEPLPLATGSPAPGAGEPIRIVGFGLPAAAGGATIKRSGTTTVTAGDERTFSSAPDPALTCYGDSGGPALADGGDREQVVGVAASGDSECSVMARHTRIDTYADFVAPDTGCRAGRPAPAAPALPVAAVLLLVRRWRRRRNTNLR